MRVKLREIKQALRRCMHRPIPEQGKWLGRVVRGYFNYHAVPTNGQALNAFRHHVTDLWRRTLRRRSQKDGCQSAFKFDPSSASNFGSDAILVQR
jgi:hypothetical protein